MSETPENTSPEKPSAAAPESPENSLQKKLEEQLRAEQQKYVYLYAEFDNYKKRVAKERTDLIKFGFENAARDLLQVADNLHRAVEHMPEGVDANFGKGIQMVLDQLNSAFKRHGVETVPSLGQTFDPNLHEAVGQAPSEVPSGHIAVEHQKGYTLHGRLLRPARVVISTGSQKD